MRIRTCRVMRCWACRAVPCGIGMPIPLCIAVLVIAPIPGPTPIGPAPVLVAMLPASSAVRCVVLRSMDWLSAIVASTVLVPDRVLCRWARAAPARVRHVPAADRNLKLLCFHEGPQVHLRFWLCSAVRLRRGSVASTDCCGSGGGPGTAMT